MSKPKRYIQLHSRPYLKDRRRSLRNNSTSAEATLWIFLKNSQLDNRKFRRQHSIENYIVDFYCFSEKLVIEVDGSVHNNVGIANADYERDLILTSMGFKVLRFTNDEIFNCIDVVLETIKEQFKM